jgi:ferredoxin
MSISRKIVLRFPSQMVGQPIIYKLVKDFDLVFNILKASVTPKEEGLLVLELKGESEAFDAGLDYLSDAGVLVEPLVQDVTRREDRCTHCGACVTICPAGAFKVDARSREISFLETDCIACELCIRACPVRAMEVRL